MNRKIFSSALESDSDWRKALSAAAAAAKKGLEGRSCDAAVFFVSESYEDFDADEFPRRLHAELGTRSSLGCNASGVIGDSCEIEMEPAVSVLAMHLPDVKVLPFAFSGAELAAQREGGDLVGALDLYPTEKPHFICLADPATCDAERFLTVFNDGYRRCPMIGGLASGGVLGKPNWLALNGETLSEGVAGLVLSGDVTFDLVVAQGCRPIGKPLIITKAQDNVLYELAGKPAFLALREILEKLGPRDKEIARHAVFVGIAMNERQSGFERGDFLIRNIMGLDPQTGALVVGAMLKQGQTLQFQLRDAEASGEDLRAHLKSLGAAPGPKGALVVSCCGRGRGLYGEADHDIRLIQNAAGPVSAAGFFANGEIGPVGARNFVHGYTSSLAIIR